VIEIVHVEHYLTFRQKP